MNFKEKFAAYRSGNVSLNGFTTKQSSISAKNETTTANLIPEAFNTEDINNILERISSSVSAFPELTDQVNYNIRERLRLQLQHVRPVDPHSERTRDYYVQIINQHLQQARVRPGDTVGVSLTALVEKLSQSALSSFHNPGDKKNVEDSITSLVQTMNANIREKAEMKVVFYPRRLANGYYSRYSYEELFRLMNHRFVQLTINDLLTWDTDNIVRDEPEILPVNELWSNLPSWYEHAINLWAPNLVISEQMKSNLMPNYLRIKFDLKKMYKYRYTTIDIYRLINAEFVGKETIFIVPSPPSVGIIDIFVSPTELGDYYPGLGSDILYFNYSILPYFGHHSIGGIKNITAVHIDYFNIEESIIVRNIATEQTDHAEWSITIDPNYYRDYGINILSTMDVWVLLLRREKIKIKTYDRNEIRVTTTDNPRLIKITPDEYNLLIQLPALPGRLNNTTFDLRGLHEFMFTAVNDTQYKSLLEVIFKWGLEIIGRHDDRFTVDVRFSTDPIRSAIYNIRNDLSKDAINPDLPPRVPTAEENILTYSYLRTRGTNILQTITWPDIDTNRIKSNNTHEIYNILGIEASRQVILDSYLILVSGSVTGSSSYDPKHLKLLADVMTRNKIISINLSGMITENTPDISQISFERAWLRLLEAAGTFSENSAFNMAAASWTGNPPIGPGFSDIAPRRKLNPTDLQRYALENKHKPPQPGQRNKNRDNKPITLIPPIEANVVNLNAPPATVIPPSAGNAEPSSNNELDVLSILMQIAQPNPNQVQLQQNMNQNMNQQILGTINVPPPPANCPYPQ